MGRCFGEGCCCCMRGWEFLGDCLFFGRLLVFGCWGRVTAGPVQKPSVVAQPTPLNPRPHPHPTPTHQRYDEYDNAAAVMMAHSPVAWEHVTFKDVVVKVSSADQYYKGMRFYLEVGLRGGEMMFFFGGGKRAERARWGAGGGRSGLPFGVLIDPRCHPTRRPARIPTH